MTQTDIETKVKIQFLLGHRVKEDKGGRGFDYWASSYLKNRGYVLTNNLSWTAPFPSRPATNEELLCVRYLQEEWDFGGLNSDRS